MVTTRTCTAALLVLCLAANMRGQDVASSLSDGLTAGYAGGRPADLRKSVERLATTTRPERREPGEQLLSESRAVVLEQRRSQGSSSSDFCWGCLITTVVAGSLILAYSDQWEDEGFWESTGGVVTAVSAGALFGSIVGWLDPPSVPSGGGSPRFPVTPTPIGSGVSSGVGTAASSGPGCQISGYPTPTNVQNLGLSWCQSNVGFQRRAFALQAAGAWCDIAIGSSSTPAQIGARHQEINATCDRLDAMQSSGIPPCQCPSGYRP